MPSGSPLSAGVGTVGLSAGGRFPGWLLQHLVQGASVGRRIGCRLTDAEQDLRPDVQSDRSAEPLPSLADLDRLGDDAAPPGQGGRVVSAAEASTRLV